MPFKNTQGTWVQLTPDELEAAISAACATRNITTDTGPSGSWSNAVATAFNATNASGLSATTRQFLIDFFTKFVGVGRTP